jgi:predicted DNA-binding transcriptional regulator AlpA
MISWRVILLRQGHTSFDAQANVLCKRLNHYIAKHPAPFSYTVRRRVALAQRALAVLEPNAVLDKSPSKSPSKPFARLAQAEPIASDASDSSFFVHPPVACACFAVHVQTGALLSQIGALDSVEKGAQIGAWLVYRVERVTWAADGSWRLPDGTSIQARETEMPPAPAPAPAPASPPSAESSLLDLAAMAKRIGVTKQTLWRWVRDGRDDIPVYGAGRTMRFDPEEMLAWFRSARTREKDS